MPPNFKRILGSRLRRLASQGKLEKVSQLKSGVSLESLALNKSIFFFPSVLISVCLFCVFGSSTMRQYTRQTQNFYKMNNHSFMAMRTPLVARPKEVNVKPRQANSQGLAVSQEKVDHAAGTAAFKFVEVDEKLELLNAAVEDRDRMIELAEQAELILLLAEELHKECNELTPILSVLSSL